MKSRKILIFFVGSLTILLGMFVFYVYLLRLKFKNPEVNYMVANPNTKNSYQSFTISQVHFDNLVDKKRLNWSPATEQLNWFPENDYLIKKIIFDINNAKYAIDYDICLYYSAQDSMGGPYRAVTGGFSEKLCFTAITKHQTNRIHKIYDLTKTPLYAPKGTRLFFNVVAYSLPRQNHSKPTYSVTVEYVPYQKGMSHFTTIRLPYIDGDITKDGIERPSYYQAPYKNDLLVKGFIVFNSFYHGKSHICLRKLKQGGKLLKEYCIPDLVLNDDTPNINPTKIYKVNWSISGERNELLGYYIKYTYNNKPLIYADGALWAIVKIPSNVNGVDAVLKDWGIVPQSFLRHYCRTTQAKGLNHPAFCAGTDCRIKTKRLNCATNFMPEANLCKHPLPPSDLKWSILNNKPFISWERSEFQSAYLFRANYLKNPWKCNSTVYPGDICTKPIKNNFYLLPYKIVNDHNVYTIWIHSVSYCGVVSQPSTIHLF